MVTVISLPQGKLIYLWQQNHEHAVKILHETECKVMECTYFK